MTAPARRLQAGAGTIKSFSSLARPIVVTALFSGFAAAVCGRAERRDAQAPIAAISHIVLGGPPRPEPGPAGRNTVFGIGLHKGASVFWAAFFEGLFGRAARRDVPAAACGATISAAAEFTDYYVVSRRFRPGFEAFLSDRALLVVCGAFALGLAVGARLARRGRHRADDDGGRSDVGNAGRHAPGVAENELGRRSPVRDGGAAASPAPPALRPVREVSIGRRPVSPKRNGAGG